MCSHRNECIDMEAEDFYCCTGVTGLLPLTVESHIYGGSIYEESEVRFSLWSLIADMWEPYRHTFA